VDLDAAERPSVAVPAGKGALLGSGSIQSGCDWGGRAGRRHEELVVTRIALGLVGVLVLAPVAAARAAAAVVETFEGPAAGTVIAGDRPGGGRADGDFFPDFTVSVVNDAGGPSSAIIFDSSNPTGGDFDLGTPNETCGGPGRGSGGEAGEPGENCTPYGNLLIIADDIVDVARPYGLVDDPDDEEEGGVLVLKFHEEVLPLRVLLVDIDDESAEVHVESDTLSVFAEASELGDNSVQVLDLSRAARGGAYTTVELHFEGSAAVAQIEYLPLTTAVRGATWADTKGRYREEVAEGPLDR
jgi:hypothetical protein